MRLLVVSTLCLGLLGGALGIRSGLAAEEWVLRPESGASRRGQVWRGCAVLAGGRLQFSAAECAGAVATGSYIAGQHTVGGWAQLRVATSAGHSDGIQMRGAGFLEGFLSAEQIHAHWHNMRAHFNLTSDAPVQWLLEQHAWAVAQAGANHTAFWRTTALLLEQLGGLVEGYAAAQRERSDLPPLGLSDFLFIGAVGDLDDVVAATSRERSVAWESLSAKQLAVRLGTSGKCSVLVRVTGGYEDILMAHSAWFTFGGLVRVYKHFDFNLHDPDIRLTGMSFSSYPGELSSDDDFYLLDTGLVVLQTTNSIYNTSLYGLLTPQSLLSWQRARVASFLATSGEEWVRLMDVHNSGSGNNQWMVVDLKRFTPRQELQPGLLWVVEQTPGLMVASDLTGTLVRGYWPSYNIPYFPAIYNRSGYPEFVAAQAARGANYAAAAVAGCSYQLSSRAKIFRRDVGSVDDLGTLRHFMRSNGWPGDEYGGGSPLGAICGRGDLDPEQPVPYGCYDTKVTNYAAALERRAYAVNGPTTADGRLPPFEWKGEMAQGVQHIGQPRKFDYDFELMTPDDSHWGAGGAAQ